MKKIATFLLILISFAACRQVPENVISRNQMENLLVDIHRAEGYIDYYSTDYRTAQDKEKLIMSVLDKHNVTKARFDTSMVWYSNNLDMYMKIYGKVYDRLVKENDLLKDELLAVERSLLSSEKDSADIWNLPRTIMLDPSTYNTNYSFEIKTDSNYKAGDKLEMEIKFINLQSDSVSYPIAMLGAQNSADSSIVRSVIAKENGWHKVVLETDSAALPKALYGNFVLIVRDRETARPVYLDSIKIMRYHKPRQLNDTIKNNRL